MSSPIPTLAREAFLALLLVLVASGCGTKQADDSAGEVKTVPRPSGGGSDAASAPRRQSCIEEDECRGGESCTGTCGVHQLGDSNCSCVDESLACTGCVLNPAFAGMLQDATAFCEETVEVGQSCSTKGATCILFDSDIDFRTPCLCWRGKSGLEWDCDDDDPAVSTPAFFKDLAPPTGSGPRPPGGGPFGGPTRDAGSTAGPDASGAP
jgi:hypothetical protein